MALFKVFRIQIPFCSEPANLSPENDRVVLKRTHHLESTSILTPPLVPRKWVDLRFDQIFHNHIIGKRLREVVRSKKGKEYRISEPTLGEYTNLAPRIVTPVSHLFNNTFSG
jgi:tRNA A58 N-methylase Trm61